MTKETRKVETQNNTAISIPESVSGAVQGKKMLAELKAQEKILAKEFTNLEKGSLRIMFALHEISDKTLYKVAKDEKNKAYKNIYDYASDKYGIARGTCSEYIKLIERFAERDALGQFTGQIMEKYASFKTSVLARLQPYALEDIDLMISDYGLTAESSYREVTKILKEYKADDLIEEKTPMEDAEESVEDAEDMEESSISEESEAERKVYIGYKFGTIRSIEELDALRNTIAEVLKRGNSVDLYMLNDAVSSMPEPEAPEVPKVPEESEAEKPKGRKAKTPMNQKKNK